jgi:hypothetical protein
MTLESYQSVPLISERAGLRMSGDIVVHRLLHDSGIATTAGSARQSADQVRMPVCGGERLSNLDIRTWPQ